MIPIKRGSDGNRRTDPQGHSGPAEASDQGNPGAITGGPIAVNFTFRGTSTGPRFLATTSFYNAPNPTPPPLPHDTAVGELIGWRVWFIRSDLCLTSLSRPNLWLPGEPMTGCPWREKEGVWAFKTRERALAMVIPTVWGPTVYGTVELWGEIIEHVDGYRAQFAQIVSLDDVHGSFPARGAAMLLDTLRILYGLT